VVDSPRAISGARPPAWQVVLAPLAVGHLRLPELSARLEDAGGETVTVGHSELPTVRVDSILGSSYEVVAAGLREPVGADGRPWELLGIAVAVLLFLPLARALWRWRRSAVAAPQRELDPFEELQSQSIQLHRQVGRSAVDRLCDELARALRTYLGRRLEIPATEMTSRELRAVATAERWADEGRRSLERVVGLADMVRFARQQPVEAELREAIAAAVTVGHFVEARLTAGAGAPPPEAAGGR
jgi:hypothetical protein